MSSPLSIFNLRSALRALAPRRLRSPLLASRRCAPPRILLAFGCFLLSGCGFHPMYGDNALGTEGSVVRGNIAIDSVGTGHEGQMLKTALEDKFNPEGLSTVNADYHLSISLRKQLIPSVVKSDGTIQRYDVRVTSDFRLFRAGKPAPIYTGQVRRTGSYNTAVNANFATYEAEQDVISRMMEEMAEDYVLRIGGYLAGKPEEKHASN